MNWLENFVRPKIRALVHKTEVPDNLWRTCPNCGRMIFHRDLEPQLYVCPHCDHHLRLSVDLRLAMLFDEGEAKRIELPETASDPLRFRDRKRYSGRLKEARGRTQENDAIVVAHGHMGGHPVVVAVLDFSFLGGSMGTAVGEGLIAAANLAILQQAPFLVVAASGGARMQEGVLSLMQMARTTVAVDRVKEAGLPYLVLLTDPTTGGVTASFAMLGDLTIAEPGSVVGFAGPRVIEETIREKLPDGFQRAEHLFEHGLLDMVVHRHKLRDILIRILGLLGDPRPAEEKKEEDEGEATATAAPAADEKETEPAETEATATAAPAADEESTEKEAEAAAAPPAEDEGEAGEEADGPDRAGGE
jgi:acetyl-CoA carboxylase carboxyl transferase subunit beta